MDGNKVRQMNEWMERKKMEGKMMGGWMEKR